MQCNLILTLFSLSSFFHIFSNQLIDNCSFTWTHSLEYHVNQVVIFLKNNNYISYNKNLHLSWLAIRQTIPYTLCLFHNLDIWLHMTSFIVISLLFLLKNIKLFHYYLPLSWWLFSIFASSSSKIQISSVSSILVNFTPKSGLILRSLLKSYNITMVVNFLSITIELFYTM